MSDSINTLNSKTAIQPDPATIRRDRIATEIGSVFVSNYPPYSFWNEEGVAEAIKVLHDAPAPGRSLGLYIHIPFCRKRCKFCYFKVYTGKNAADIQTYLDALVREIEIYATLPALQRRPLKFVYFGGGTPSFISVKHLTRLVEKARAALSWEQVEEVAFECEPGTLSHSKLEAIKEIGVTRLSLGIEHFNDLILHENGRAHLSKEIFRVQPWVKAQSFEQVNIDLIAGMVGDHWESWKDTVRQAIDYDPDSITIYQMELPFNAVYSKELRDGNPHGIAVADWQTKREWHLYAIEQLEAAGYEISSAYTMIKKDSKNKKFVYRDALWHGSDMIPTGVASFGHLNGIHFQNTSRWDLYLNMTQAGKLPLQRAFRTTPDERLVREMILQLKLGKITPPYFREKFGVDVLKKFAPVYTKLRDEGMLTFSDQEIILSRQGLLRVDQLLPEFYHPQYQNARYT